MLATVVQGDSKPDGEQDQEKSEDALDDIRELEFSDLAEIFTDPTVL